MSIPRRLFSSGRAVVLACIAGIACYGWLAYRTYQELAPPQGIDTLAEFRAFLPEPRSIVRIDDHGLTRIVVMGEQPLVLFSEAPAAYLFDAEGNLLDWSVEATDTDRMARVWQLAQDELRANRELDYDEVIARQISERAAAR